MILLLGKSAMYTVCYEVAPLFEIVFVLHVGEVLTAMSVYKLLNWTFF